MAIPTHAKDQTAQYQTEYYRTHPKLKEKSKERERKKRADARAFRKVKTQKTTTLFTLEGLGFLFLVSAFTFLLVREMAGFYAESDGFGVIAWLKATALVTSHLIGDGFPRFIPR